MSPTPVLLNQQSRLIRGISTFPNDLTPLLCGPHLEALPFQSTLEESEGSLQKGLQIVPATKERQSGDTDDRCGFIKPLIWW